MKSNCAKMKSMDNHIQKGIATSFNTHHNPFSYCRFSPDCQAFVHDVGSTDSMRIKDILWLSKIPFNQIHLLLVDLGKEFEFFLTNPIFNDACSSCNI